MHKNIAHCIVVIQDGFKMPQLTKLPESYRCIGDITIVHIANAALFMYCVLV